ncbi:MAG: VCBS repeat-containing protein [Planctomycetes bacterium]|nr:VCBS repeat-containing protein [Planctomycetota bacterium]
MLALRNFVCLSCLAVPTSAQHGLYPFPGEPSRPLLSDVATGDFDGDSRVDVLARHDGDFYGYDSLTLHFGDGRGGFRNRLEFAYFNTQYAIAAADLDGDGDDEAVLAADYAPVGPCIEAWHAAETGWQLLERTPLAFVAHDVLMVDLDFDGVVDLVAAHHAGALGAMEFLRGVGDGTFVHAASLTIGSNASHMLARDVDQDGRLDLVGLRKKGVGDKPWVALGLGGFAFAAPHDVGVGGWISDLDVGDLDGDGHADLVCVAPVTQPYYHLPRVLISFGAGDGTFGAEHAVTLSGDPNAVRLADIDADGRLDVALGLRVGVQWLRGDGLGGFSAVHELPATPHAGCLEVDDFDRDGAVDFVVGFRERLILVCGPGTPELFAPLRAVDVPSFPKALAELTGDAHADVLFVDAADPWGTFVAPGRGDGTFAPSIPIASLVGAVRANAGDLNGDGTADVVAVCSSSTGPNLRVALADGAGGFHSASQGTALANVPQQEPHFADVDSDGDLDVWLAYANTVRIARNRGAGELNLLPTPAMVGGGWYFTTLDFDLDGLVDLAALGFGPNRIALARNLGNGVFAPALLVSLPLGDAGDICALDVNGDAKDDLAVHSLYEPIGIYVLLGRGDGSFEPARFTPLLQPSFVDEIVPFDADGDGFDDLLVGSHDPYTAFAALLMGSASGAWKRIHAYASGRDAIVVGDANGDGRVDLLGTDMDGVQSLGLVLSLNR